MYSFTGALTHRIAENRSYSLIERPKAMTKSTQDHWAQWILHQRFGGDPHRLQAMYERDLLTFVEQAGFAEIHLELQITIKQSKLLDHSDETTKHKWETLLKSSWN